MELDWKNLPDDWDGENCWRNQAWEDCSGPKRSLGDFSNQDYKFASRDCLATISRPHLCVLAVLTVSRKQDTPQKRGMVPDSMNNPDCELVVS